MSFVRRTFIRGLRYASRATGHALAPRASSPVLTLERESDAIYAVGNPHFALRIDYCHYPFGLRYAEWHPFVATLKQYMERGASLTYDESVLKRYYEAFQPNNVLELYFPPGVAALHQDAALASYDLRRYSAFLPWDLEVKESRGEVGLSADHGHQAYGPVSREKGELEFRRLVGTFEAIRREGYKVEAGGGISGYFLLRGDEYRFLVRRGLHRMAVLAALGYRQVPVALHPAHPRALHAETVAKWPLVRAGVFVEPLARCFIDQFFEERSWLEDHVRPAVHG